MRHKIAIEIAGVCPEGQTTPWRWCGYQPLNPTATTRANALLTVGQFSASVAEGEALAQSGVTTFVLCLDDLTSYGTRPVDIFGVVGAENLTSAQVWSAMSLSAGAAQITLETGPTFGIGKVLHIGTEMIVSTTSRSTALQSNVNITRGQGGTLAAPHRAAYSGYFARSIPVTSVPSVWIGRRVTVYVDETVWRVGYLVDNPQISGNQITLQYVSQENLLSSERSGDYIPAFGTTLTPTPESSGRVQYWAGAYFSIPAMRLNIPYGEASILTKEECLEVGAGNNYVQAPSAVRLQCMWWHYDSDSLGAYNHPRVWVTWSRGWVDVAHEDTGEAQYELEVDSNAYEEWGTPYTEIGIDWEFSQYDPNYQAMLDCNDTHSSNWTLLSVRTSAYTYPDWANQRALVGTHSSMWGDHYPWCYDYDYDEPFDWQLQQTCCLIHNKMSMGEGYPIKHDGSYFGIMWRHNVVGEVEPDAPQGNLFTPLPVSNVWGTELESQLRPCPVDGRCKRGDLYPVRPRVNGEVHNSYTSSGCGLVFDAWFMGYNDVDGVIPCDVATAYWEVGTQGINTVALIPGVGTNWAPISISWTEPDDTELTATAEVRRWSSWDYSGTYGYQIRNVTLSNGTPCVGFGTWPGKPQCRITKPVGTQGRMGEIVCRIISSGDGTSGRQYDQLGDGLGCPITGAGALSLYNMSLGLAMTWQFDPVETAYGDYLRTAALCSQKMIVGALDAGGYGPHAVPAGRPMLGEQVATWTDADIIGLPSSSADSGLVYTGYHVKTRWEEYSIADWLAADLFGQSNECELDLTGMTISSQFGRDLVRGLTQSIVDGLRDRFGVSRRRWSLTVPIDIGLPRAVGDVVSITSDHLIAPDGQIGVSGYLARIMSISHDLVGGQCQVELVAYGAYVAGYAPSWDCVVSSVSGTVYTFNFVTSSDPVEAQRQIYDRLHFSPSGTTHYAIGITGKGSCGYIYGQITSWAPTESGGQCVMSRTGYSNPICSAGDRVLIIGYSSNQYPTAYTMDSSRLA